jgi:hypothetical protein
MKTFLATLPALLIATPGLAHHEEATSVSSTLLHSPWGIAVLAALFIAAGLAARQHALATVSNKG